MVKINSEALSDIGCNIASGIIIEKLVDKNIKDVKYLINGLTLYRNFLGCIDGKTNDKISILKSGIDLTELYSLFIEDTKVLLENLLSNNIDVIIYIPDYSSLKKSWSNFIDKDKVGAYKYYVRITQEDAMSKLKKEFSNIILETNHKLPYYRNMYITTHIGHDLLSYTKYSSVTLVESHTAEFKKKNKWYTKYHKLGKNDLSILPFNRAIYSIFGDDVHIRPQSISLRRYIYEIAKSMKWYSGMIEAVMLTTIKQKDSSLYNDIKNTYINFFK